MVLLIAARAVGELEAAKKTGRLPAGLRWRPHADPRARAVEIWTTTAEGDSFSRSLAERHGRRFWSRGAWHTECRQLAIPGLTAAGVDRKPL